MIDSIIRLSRHPRPGRRNRWTVARAGVVLALLALEAGAAAAQSGPGRRPAAPDRRGDTLEAPAPADTAAARRRASRLLEPFGDLLPCPLEAVVRVRVDPGGRVVRATIHRTSDDGLFDFLARGFARSLHFRPARHHDRPIPSTALLPVRRECGAGTDGTRS